MADSDAPLCPFCGYKAAQGQYMLLMHMEQYHSEGPSPFVAEEDHQQHQEVERSLHQQRQRQRQRSGPAAQVGGADGYEDSSDGDMEQLTECPIEGCGEVLVADEMDYHLELHREEADGNGTAAVLADRRSPSATAAAAAAATTTTTTPPATAVAAVAAVAATEPSPSPAQEARARERRASRQSSSAASRREGVHRHHSSSRRDPLAPSRQQSTIQAWKSLFGIPPRKRGPPERERAEQQENLPAPPGAAAAAAAAAAVVQKKRLGKNELGKYAHERKMPEWLVSHLQRGGQVVGEGIIPVIRRLLEQCPTTMYAYVCHPCVQHVSKLKREGGFCGYRNIQMVASYVVGAKSTGEQHFGGRIPSIFQIQDFIEDAWDRGINSQGRVETGGVKGTRKYIGTPEAQAVFVGLQIPCEAQGFKDKEPGRSEQRLFEAIELYFQQGFFNPESKVRCTTLPPIYFQHAGHSMTIVGFEKMTSGEMNLLVFDPMFHDAASVTRLVGQNFQIRNAESVLKPYRRGNKYLRKYREFELLKLRPPPGALLPN